MVIVEEKIRSVGVCGRRFHSDFGRAVLAPAQRTKTEDDRNADQSSAASRQNRPGLLIVAEDRKRNVSKVDITYSQFRRHCCPKSNSGSRYVAEGALCIVDCETEAHRLRLAHAVHPCPGIEEICSRGFINQNRDEDLARLMLQF